jgi:hypothetical protein
MPPPGRTGVLTLKGLRPGPLDDGGGFKFITQIISLTWFVKGGMIFLLLGNNIGFSDGCSCRAGDEEFHNILRRYIDLNFDDVVHLDNPDGLIAKRSG